jgi:cytoskeleton protein RodZ
MSEPLGLLGARLKAERERRGLSPAKAADELHLDAWVIDALEAEDYERIGPSVYAKGHLKRYAALLGLPVPEILAGYEIRVQVPKPSASQPANVRLRTDTPAVSNLPWPQIVGSVAVVLLIIGVLWWKPWHQRGAEPARGAPMAANPSAASSGSATDAGGAVLNSSSASPTMPVAAAPSSAAPSSTVPGSAAAIAAGQSSSAAAAASGSTAGIGRARLRLSFSADSWVDVHDAAGRRVFAGKGRANSVKVIHGVAPMRVYLGFASGVQLEINDRAVAIGPQFVAGDVARFEAGADGILRRDSHGAVQTRDTRPTG